MICPCLIVSNSLNYGRKFYSSLIKKVKSRTRIRQLLRKKWMSIESSDKWNRSIDFQSALQAVMLHRLVKEGKIKSMDDPIKAYNDRFSIRNPFNSEDITFRWVYKYIIGDLFRWLKYIVVIFLLIWTFHHIPNEPRNTQIGNSSVVTQAMSKRLSYHLVFHSIFCDYVRVSEIRY